MLSFIVVVHIPGSTFNAKCILRHRMLAGTSSHVRIKALAKEGFWNDPIVQFNLGARLSGCVHLVKMCEAV